MSEKILIVEDEVDVAELLAHHLKKAGFVVEMATNGRVALASIRDQPPTLVVLDLMLPEMSGLDLCRAIRSDPRTKEMAVVMLSAASPHDHDCLQVGEILLDRSRHEVKAANRVIECTATEFKLLRLLMEREGRVQGRDRLLSDVWGYDSIIDTRTVDTHMRRLRDKLGSCGRYIETVRGFGYRLAVPH